MKFIPLGGLGEIGKNMYAVEYGDDIIVVDCGLMFPDQELPGIDYIVPDISYLEANREKVLAIIITHGHEDHTGALPFVLPRLNVPLYGTRLTLGLIGNKLKEDQPTLKTHMNEVKAGDVIRIGPFSVRFIAVSHSIPDAVALSIETPLGRIVHTGDFKLDSTPIDGRVTDYGAFAEEGDKGVLLLASDSTNAERKGCTATIGPGASSSPRSPVTCTASSRSWTVRCASTARSPSWAAAWCATWSWLGSWST